LLAGLTALSGSTSQAAAAIVAANSTPPKVSVAGTGTASVSVTWRVVRQGLDLPDPGTVRSPDLRIVIGGAVAATQPRSLSHALPGTEENEIATFHETIQIPEALVYRAVKQRSTLSILRSFDDGDGSQVAELQVTPSSSASAVLTVERLSLSFDDDTRVRVLPKGSKLRVVAELLTQGVGQLNAQWEIADGTTTAGQPVFRILALVRQGVAGGGRTVITSPQLPTSAEGTALVRLRVIAPGLGFTSPTLQYYVTPGEDGAAMVAQQEMFPSAPQPGEPLTAQTRFAWTAVAGSEAYQIAFYATPAGPGEPLDPAKAQDVGATPGAAPGGTAPDADPLAAVFVPGDRTEASLEPFTLGQLRAERSYLWRVLAIDANGAVIGSSAAKEIFKP
jgi:hypothetical protein